jgi:hypothetical protein
MPEQQLIWDGKSETRQNPTVYRAPDASDWQMITRQLQNCQGVAYAGYQSATFVAGQALLKGQPFIWQAGKIWAAYNDVMGFVIADVEINGTALAITSGQVSRDDWTPVAGSISLEMGVPYFLNPLVAGTITTTPPSAQGQFVIELGRALTDKVFDVKINPPMGL